MRQFNSFRGCFDLYPGSYISSFVIIAFKQVVLVCHDATLVSNDHPSNVMMAQSLRRLVGAEYVNK